MKDLKDEKIRLLEELLETFKGLQMISHISAYHKEKGRELIAKIKSLTEQINAEPVNNHCRRSHTDKMGRHKTIEKPEPVSNPDELRSAYETILSLIDRYWKFDEYQHPVSSWHDKQDLLQAVKEALQSNTPSDCDSEKCDRLQEALRLLDNAHEYLKRQSNTQQKQQPRMTADKMNCLEHSLEMWNDNNSLKLFYNSNHVIAIEDGYLIARKIPNPWYEPIENYGYDHIVKSFELCAKYALILASYLHNANQFKQ